MVECKDKKLDVGVQGAQQLLGRDEGSWFPVWS